MRAGPFYTVGHAWSYKKQPRRAALALLRVPVAYAEHRALAARALVEAGEQVERLGDRPGAARLYREVLTDHPRSPAATEARALLDALARDE